jgi:hypothetical protein
LLPSKPSPVPLVIAKVLDLPSAVVAFKLADCMRFLLLVRVKCEVAVDGAIFGY